VLWGALWLALWGMGVRPCGPLLGASLDRAFGRLAEDFDLRLCAEVEMEMEMGRMALCGPALVCLRVELAV
jgi:hypothetical protein